MTTLSDIRGNVVRMIGSNAHFAEIEREIVRACEKLSRENLHVSEVAEFSFVTVADQQWYTSVDLSSAVPAVGTNDSASMSVRNIIKIKYLMATPGAGGIDDGLDFVSFDRFQRLSEGNSSGGYPTVYTVWANRIGLWPVPSTVYTVQGDGVIKPVIPTSITSECAYFDEYPDLVEAIVAGQIFKKYAKDPAAASMYADEERRLMSDIRHEDAMKRTSGKLAARR
jgi:hypothetical protein